MKNRIGEKYGKLTVIAFSHKKIVQYENYKVTYLFWKCRCECGNEKVIKANKLIQHITKSCGCGSSNPTGKKKYEDCGDIDGQYLERLKRGSKKRGFTFSISGDYLWNLFLLQNRKCSLSGRELILKGTVNQRVKKTASLDRIDSSKGYIEGNVQWVHKDINKLKSNFSELELISLCNDVSNFNAQKTAIVELMAVLKTV